MVERESEPLPLATEGPVEPSIEAPERPVERSQVRRFFAMLVIGVATSQILGYTLDMPAMLSANDISRWCTVWSLLERGSYAIDECPWQYRTQDKVYRPFHLEEPSATDSPLKRFEYWLAPASWKETDEVADSDTSGDATPPTDDEEQTPADEEETPTNGEASTKTEEEAPDQDSATAPAEGEVTGVDDSDGRERHYYSSKPPLLPTVIAGLLYPFHKASGVALDEVTETPRMPERNVMVPVEGKPGQFRFEVERDRKPVEWPVFPYYFKPIIILFNIVPFFAFLVLFARLLDRHAENDWAWFFSLIGAAWGTYLFAFDSTLNNHTIAAYSAFFALYAMIRIISDGERSWIYFANAGFWGAFCACNELPAALFGILLFLILLARFPKKTLLAFVPAAAVPCVAFLITGFLAFGQFMPVYAEFGTQAYEYEGSYWQTPLEFDYLNKFPEPKAVYLFHMTFGHHGIFSLTPIFLFSIWGVLANLFGERRRLSLTAWLTLILTTAMIALYTWNPKARNYGGSTQGLRWLFWLIPFWVIMLPLGVKAGQNRKLVRWLSLLALAVSVLSVGYALRMPWSHPWILDLMERAGLYELKR